MAPVTRSTDVNTHQEATEDMPLLGRVGASTQKEGEPLYVNLLPGTASLAQLGIILLTVAVWQSFLSREVILFTYHPLLNSAGILFITQAILIVQPTHTPSQKRKGGHAHAILNGIGFSALVAGLVIIEYNKISHQGAHFKSVHGYLGVITYIVLALQSIVGFTQFYTPTLYGSVSNAKAIYKYHRLSGYLALILMLATVAAATKTDFILNVIHLRLWVVITTSILILLGIIPRIKLHKLGFKSPPISS